MNKEFTISVETIRICCKKARSKNCWVIM